MRDHAASCREWREKNKEKVVQYRQKYAEAHKTEILENCKKWKQKNKAKVKSWSKRYYDANKELIKQKTKRWQSENKDKRRIQVKAQVAKRRLLGVLSVKIIQELYEGNIKLNGTLTCGICNKKIGFGDDVLDHKKPISRGGPHDKSNLHIVHATCNKKKHTKTLEEYIACVTL